MSWAPLTPGTNNFSAVPAATLTAACGPVSVGDTINVSDTFGQTAGLVPATSVVTDSLGNVYTNETRVDDTTHDQVIETWLSIVTHAGTPTVQIQFNPTPGVTVAQNCSLNVDPFTGSDASSVSDGSNSQHQVAPGAGADAVSSNTWTTATNGDLIYGASVDSSTGADPGTKGTGFTDATISGGVVLHSVWKSQAAASASTKVTFTAATGGDDFITAGHAVTPAMANAAVGRFIAPVLLW